jgi:hypothetical protein
MIHPQARKPNDRSGRSTAMALSLTDCKATPSSITIFFSDAVDASGGANGAMNPANYTVYDPNVAAFANPAALTAANAKISYEPFRRAAVIDLIGVSFNAGDWVTVKVLKIAVTSAPGVSATGAKGLNIGAQVNGTSERGQIIESVEDAVSYPLLTEQVSFPRSGSGPTTGSTPMGGGRSSLGQTAALAVGDVLGWKVSSTDPKGFIGALTQAFTLNDVEGHVESTWNPRTCAIQTDLGGGITGAQASLYTRAKDALDQSTALLDGLYPLDPEADPEYVKALREMARSQMTEIVKEFAVVGLPSVLRINTYFDILLGQHDAAVQFDPDQVGGTLGTLRQEYGIFFKGNPFSNSIEDEQDITNFRVISDYMTSLLQSWISNRQYFLLGLNNQPAFFGTQLVLISRQFSVVAETVNEVRFALDSVFIGPSERHTLLLEFGDPALPAMFIEDMLEEIENLAITEGPRLLQDGGRLSVNNNILPVARSLRNLVGKARHPRNLRDLLDGYKTVRVQRTLDDLHDQIRELIRLSQPVGRNVPTPEDTVTISGILPATGLSGNVNVPITIFGTAFDSGVSVTFDFPVPLTLRPGQTGGFYSNQRIDVVLDLTNVPPDDYDVTVTNPDTTTVTSTDGFTVQAAAMPVAAPGAIPATPSEQELIDAMKKYQPKMWKKVKRVFP